MQNNELLLKLIEMVISGGHKNQEATTTTNKGRYIVIGNRGNIVVGDLSICGDTGTLKNASVIRRWGTKEGLGQLAIHGKQQETMLDFCGEFEFDVKTTCGMIKVTSDL